jgi:hydroxymethylbilane synthase
MAQATLVRDALRKAGRPSRIVVIETDGDRRAPDTAWGEGAFVVAIEQALLAGRVDVAVHSAKDVPTEQDPRLQIAAYLPRADPRDALVVRGDAAARRLADLPAGSRVGTDSPRRTGFLLARRPDLAVHPLHGNVDTRLRRLDDGETDALVLACAGLDRMGLGHRIAERLEPDVVPPAPGQGAIAVQVRRDDVRVLELTATIDDQPTRVAVEAERAFLSASGGGCRAPIGALASVADGHLELLGGYASVDGADSALARRRGAVGAGVALARELAAELDSYARIRPAVDGTPDPRTPRARGRRVLVTRAAEQAGELVSALRAAGLDPVTVPTIAVELEPPGGELDAVARRLGTYAWVVVTSANGARAILDAVGRTRAELRGPAWAVIAPGTRRVLEQMGITADFEPSHSSASAVAAGLPLSAGDRVLVVRGDLAGEALAVALRARGAEVDDVVGYRTDEAPASSRRLLRRAWADGPIDVVAFTSGSTVRGFVALARAEQLDVGSIGAVCIGPETAAAARDAGFSVLAVPLTPDPLALAVATADALAALSKETR